MAYMSQAAKTNKSGKINKPLMSTTNLNMVSTRHEAKAMIQCFSTPITSP